MGDFSVPGVVTSPLPLSRSHIHMLLREAGNNMTLFLEREGSKFREKKIAVHHHVVLVIRYPYKRCRMEELLLTHSS